MGIKTRRIVGRTTVPIDYLIEEGDKPQDDVADFNPWDVKFELLEQPVLRQPATRAHYNDQLDDRSICNPFNRSKRIVSDDCLVDIMEQAVFKSLGTVTFEIWSGKTQNPGRR
jgi:hypothetical protein